MEPEILLLGSQHLSLSWAKLIKSGMNKENGMVFNYVRKKEELQKTEEWIEKSHRQNQEYMWWDHGISKNRI